MCYEFKWTQRDKLFEIIIWYNDEEYKKRKIHESYSRTHESKSYR